MRYHKIDLIMKGGKKKRTREELKAAWSGRPGYRMGLAGVEHARTV